MNKDEKINQQVYNEILEIVKYTTAKDSNVDPKEITSAVNTYLKNNPIKVSDSFSTLKEAKEYLGMKEA